MGREQKYKARQRYFYALLFDNGHCYIGQSTDLKRREREHRRFWLLDFRMLPLGSIEGTQADGEEHEYAWRYVASRQGWRVYGRNRAGETFLIDPRKRLTWKRRAIASRLRWPASERRGSPWRLGLVLIIALALGWLASWILTRHAFVIG
jgi:hypothetical protein